MKLPFAILLFSTCLLAAAPATLPRTTPATAPSASEVQKLVTQLAAEKFQDRETAQERLIALGVPVLPLLDSMLAKTTDAEILSRLQLILRDINRADIDHPTPITLHMKNAMPKDVVAALVQQCDAEITGSPADWFSKLDIPVSLDVDHEPFRNVIEELCRQAHLRYSESGGVGDRKIIVQNKIAGVNVAIGVPFNKGCFQITPLIATVGNAPDRTLLNFHMFIDPKLVVLRSTTAIRIDEVTDSKGQSLKFNAPLNPDEFSATNSWSWKLAASIITPADGIVATFKGSVRVHILDQAIRWNIANPLAAKGMTRDLPFGKATITEISKPDIEKVRAMLGPDMYEVWSVKTSLDLAPGQEAQFGGNSIVGGNVRLWDEKGYSSRPAILGIATLKNGHAEFSNAIAAVTTADRNLATVSRLTWEIPSGVKEILVPFEFKNIPVK